MAFSPVDAVLDFMTAVEDEETITELLDADDGDRVEQIGFLRRHCPRTYDRIRRDPRIAPLTGPRIVREVA